MICRLILRGSKLIEIFLDVKYALTPFTQLSTNPDIHPLFPVPVPMQPSPLRHEQCLLYFYELCDVLHHHMRPEAFHLYQEACLSFIFRRFITIIFDMYAQYQKTRKISTNLTRFIEKHISEVQKVRSDDSIITLSDQTTRS